MIRPIRARGFVVAVALAGCSSAPPSPSTPTVAPTGSGTAANAKPAEPAMAPTPYTAEQIRDATRVGRTYEFLIESPDTPPVRRKLVFVAVDRERARVESSTIDAKGKPVGEPEQNESTWEELRQHASWPKASTTIEPGTATTPAGTFSCMKYTVVEKKDGKELRTVACFANDMPGPPVEMRKEANGDLVMSMVLLRHDPGP